KCMESNARLRLAGVKALATLAPGNNGVPTQRNDRLLAVPPTSRAYILCMANSLPTRSDALALMHEYTASESLRKHMLSVEAAMRAYAAKLGEDPERWGLAGLIHDFDYERFPNNERSATEEHPSSGVRILREKGWPQDILDAIMGHAAYTNTPRVTP